MQQKVSLLFFLFFLWSATLPAQTVDSHHWSKHKAKKWVKQGTWRNGLELKPNKTIDAKQFAEQYFKNKESWDKAFAFLKEHDLQKIEKGKYPVDGDKVTASVTTDSSKNFEKTNWESHQKFIDLQYVIMGEEKMGVYPVAKATVTKPYDEKKDVANYTADGKYYSATPASFFLFFPTDAHRPNITPGGNKVVKKIVLKIKVAE